MRAVVVGGGIAGVSIGFHLAAEAEVILVEQEPVLAYHTSGRSAAVFVASIGSNPVPALLDWSRTFFENPPDGLADHPLLSPRGVLTVGRRDQVDSLTRAAAVAVERGATVERLGPPEAIGLVPALREDQVAGALFDPDASDIDVAATHQAFVRGMRRRGATIITSTPVSALDRKRHGWRVTAGEHSIDADVVVNAAGAWGDVVAGLAGVPPIGLVALRRTAFMVPGDEMFRAWPMVVDVDEEFYFKPDGVQFLCSLAEEIPSEPGDVRAREEDVALAIDRINAATTLAIRSVRSSWCGLRTFAPDRLQVVGFDPGFEGFFWCVGQGGSGFETAPALSYLAASLVLDGRIPADLIGLGLDGNALAPARFRD